MLVNIHLVKHETSREGRSTNRNNLLHCTWTPCSTNSKHGQCFLRTSHIQENNTMCSFVLDVWSKTSHFHRGTVQYVHSTPRLQVHMSWTEGGEVEDYTWRAGSASTGFAQEGQAWLWSCCCRPHFYLLTDALLPRWWEWENYRLGH